MASFGELSLSLFGRGAASLVFRYAELSLLSLLFTAGNSISALSSYGELTSTSSFITASKLFHSSSSSESFFRLRRYKIASIDPKPANTPMIMMASNDVSFVDFSYVAFCSS